MQASSDSRDVSTSASEALRIWREETKQRAMALRQDACASFGAMAKWNNVASEEQWAETCDHARQAVRSGCFLLDQMGAERHVAPEIAAALLVLRQGLLEELGAESTTDYLLVDTALIFHFQMLRASRLIGDLALLVHDEFFLLEAPLARLEKRHGRDAFKGFRCEGYVERIVEQLAPLMDRANKGMLRNLRAAHEMKRSPSARLSIARVGQMNVAGEMHVAQGIDQKGGSAE
jgi:hypothetical protein